MPFGTFEIDGIKRNKNYVPPVRPQYANPVRPKNQAANQVSGGMPLPGLSVLIVGETQELIGDFMTAMYGNMKETLMRGGMLFDAADGHTSSEMMRISGGIRNCVSGGMPSGWPIYGNQAVRRYSYSIKASGNQARIMGISFTGVTPDMNPAHMTNNVSAVWVLVPGSASPHADTAYEAAVKRFLYSSGISPNISVTFLISQFEHIALFGRCAGNDIPPPDNVRHMIYNNCRITFNDIFKARGRVGRMCQLQLYGGMKKQGINRMGKPVFNANSKIGYVPVACHLPVLYMIVNARKSGHPYFRTPQGAALWDRIKRCFAGYIGRPEWKTEFVNEGAAR